MGLLDKIKREPNKKPKGPVNQSFRGSSPPGGFEKTDPSKTQWFNTKEDSRKSIILPAEPLTSPDPAYPDLGNALRESQRPEYLPSSNLGVHGSEQVDVRPLDPGTIDPHPIEPQPRASRSPERRSGLWKNNDSHRDVKDLRREIKDIESEHKRTVKGIEEHHAREAKRLKEQHMGDTQRAANELKMAQQDANKQAAEASRLRQELNTVKTNIDQDRRRMEADHASKISSMHHDMQMARNNAEQRERQMTQIHEDALRSLNQQIQNAKTTAEAKEQRLRQDHNQTLNKLNESHKAQLLKQEQEHQQSKRQQQLEIEELNEAWLNRDDEIYQSLLFTTSGLPRKPDDKIKSQVSELQQIIDDLSRLEWKSSPQVWTDRVLQRLGSQHGQRSLRKAIIQDLIWSLLFQWIFCSPFRMFGEKGLELEREWNEQCGKGT
jgi:hypothetical protein